MFKKIASRKVITFFMLHITFAVMYYFSSSDMVIWAMLINGFVFITFNTIDKIARIIENVKKNN